MPKLPGLACRYPGCGEVLPSGEKGYCELHKSMTNKNYNKNRTKPAGIGYGKQWEKIRLMVLRNEPLCRRCKAAGLIVPATLVHHIDEDTNNVRRDNLEPLCSACHNKHHGWANKNTNKKQD